MTDFVTASPASELEVELSDGHDSPDFLFAAEGLPRLAAAISLNVMHEGDLWSGDFFGGEEPTNAVVTGLDSKALLVVAGGVGYHMQADSPADYQVVAPRPVRTILVDHEDPLVVLVGYTTVSAIGPSGQLWTSDRLSRDGFADAWIASGVAFLRGLDIASGDEVETRLQASTGEILSKK